jgi:hypothetical protein
MFIILKTIFFVKVLRFQILICRGGAGEMRASGGKPLKRLERNFQLG